MRLILDVGSRKEELVRNRRCEAKKELKRRIPQRKKKREERVKKRKKS